MFWDHKAAADAVSVTATDMKGPPPAHTFDIGHRGSLVPFEKGWKPGILWGQGASTVCHQVMYWEKTGVSALPQTLGTQTWALS